MRPLKLTIKNLRSFRAERSFDFTDLRLCAIVGDTGAGKTSILEAITYALYNRSTWSGRNVKELIAKGADTMSVVFNFSVDGVEYEITRVTRERGASMHRLRCSKRAIDVNGEADVKAAVLDALHLSDDTFLRTVLLPQGQHAQLLTADKGTRNNLLGELFRLDEIAKVGELAKSQTSRVEAVLDARRRDRDAIGGELEQQLQHAEKNVTQAQAALDAAKAAESTVKALDAQIGRAQQTLTRLDARRNDLAAAPALLEEISGFNSKIRDIDDRTTNARLALEAAQREQAAAQDDLQGLAERDLGSTSLNGYKVRLTECAAELRERLKEAKALVEAQDALPVQSAAYETKRKAKADAELVVTQARQAVETADAATQAERVKVGAMEAAITKLNGAKAAAKTAAVEIKRHTGEVEMLRGQVNAAEVTLRRLQHEAQEARLAFDQARSASGAAAVGAHLHAGDKCPVCLRTLPKDFVPPNDADLLSAETRDQQAQKAVDVARADLGALRERLASAEGLLNTAESNHRTQAAEIERICGDLPPDARTDPDGTLRARKTALQAMEDQLRSLRETQDAAFSTAMQVGTQEAHAAADLRTLERRIATLVASVQTRGAAYATKVAQIPEIFRPPSEDEPGIAAAGRRIDDALAIADAAAKRESSARNAVVTARSAVASLDQERSETITTPRMKALALLDAIAGVLGDQRLPAHSQRVSAWVATIGVAAARERAKVDAERDEVERLVTRAHDQREAVVKALGVEPAEAVTNTAVAKTNAERDVADVRHRIDQRKALEAKIGQIEPVYLGMKTLKDELGAAYFKRYATEQRQASLLAEASRILMEMTNSRYGFTKEFEIFDSATNEARVPQTLSGGEKFLTSLALSLAVVEIAANSGAKIESLFLDEGFATLNTEWVDVAMVELRKRARQGRAICVISHLSEVAQFADTTFRVQASADGSDYSVIHGAIEQDEAAMEGLLTQLSAGSTT